MNNTINTYLGSLHIGEKQTHKNLSMYPIICPEGVSLDYLLLDEALAGNVIEIAELNQGGSVPELKVVNKAQKMVLLLDGEELVGAKQNRIINTTILIAANSTTTIPVSCVEQGRWSYRSNTFHSEERVMSHKLRAMKAEHVNISKKLHNSYRSDQGAIWGLIADKAAAFECLFRKYGNVKYSRKGTTTVFRNTQSSLKWKKTRWEPCF